MKVIIPVAGLGSRLKPHTFSRPKPLMEVAGKPILDSIIEDVLKLDPDEIIFVVGYMRQSVEDHIHHAFPDVNTSFVYQSVRDGDGSAIRLALELIEDEDELFVVFGDTMVDFEYSKVLTQSKETDVLVLAKEVEDPTHYGIMTVDETREIIQVEEKPKNPKSDMALIGSYYFKSLLSLKQLLNRFYENKETVKGEYKIIQAIECFIKMKDVSVKGLKVKEWFDCGRPEVLLQANKYFLEKQSVGIVKPKTTSIIIPPSYVSKNAIVEHSVIGPHASIGDNVKVTHSTIKNSIISSDAVVENMVLEDSLVGKQAKVMRAASKVNIGERSEFHMH